MSIDVVIPEVGEGVRQATIVAWHRAVGESIAQGEPLVDIMTDKVNVVIDAPASGVIAEILHGADEEVRIGAVIGRIGGGKA
ncbi:MAG: hypothetical protein FJX47_12320 [Alphaproteobacteria bacterium]|nr:hypothetical protein [Alphaproteobacteria bacterium]